MRGGVKGEGTGSKSDDTISHTWINYTKADRRMVHQKAGKQGAIKDWLFITTRTVGEILLQSIFYFRPSPSLGSKNYLRGTLVIFYLFDN